MTIEHALIPTVLQRHSEYIAKWKLDGKPVAVYTTPCCSRLLETTAPAANGESWDALVTCPHCGELFMKEVAKVGAAHRVRVGTPETGMRAA